MGKEISARNEVQFLDWNIKKAIGKIPCQYGNSSSEIICKVNVACLEVMKSGPILL